jgi:hypothetical protein
MSCTEKHNHIPIGNFSTRRVLIAEQIPIKTLIAPEFFMISSDYLSLYSSKKDTMIDIFSLPDLSYVKSFGTKGKGPGEFQNFPIPCKSNNKYMYIWGYTPVIIKQLSIDSTFNFQVKSEYRLPAYEAFNQMHIVQDSLLIYNNIGTELSVVKINLKNHHETEKISIDTEDHNESFFYANRGIIAANDRFIVYVFLFKKQIYIYDVNTLKLTAKLIGVDNLPSITIGDFNNIAYRYTNVFAGEKYFYALYNKNNDYPFSQCVIEVFGYDGKQVIEYIINESIFHFAIDEVNSMMYAYDGTDENNLLRYALPLIYDTRL